MNIVRNEFEQLLLFGLHVSFNGDSIERVDFFKFLCTIISSDLSWGNITDAVVKKCSTKAILPAPTKEVRAEEGDSCSVLSFCC